MRDEDEPVIVTVRKFVRRADIMGPHFDAIERALAAAMPDGVFEAQRLIGVFGRAAGIYDPGHQPPWHGGVRTTIDEVRAEWLRLQDVQFDVRRVVEYLREMDSIRAKVNKVKKDLDALAAADAVAEEDERWGRYIR